MNQNETIALIKHQPSVHRLYFGSFIQEPLELSENLYAIPLKELGFADELEYCSVYLDQFFNTFPDVGYLQKEKERLDKSKPVIALIFHTAPCESPEQAEQAATSMLELGEQLLSWISGDHLKPFSVVTSLEKVGDTFIRFIPPHSRRRVRLGFGNSQADIQRTAKKILSAAEEDEHFAFALSLLSDATHEPNPKFKLARLFNVLEALAYALKGDGIGSRRAVKKMMGLEEGAMASVNVDGQTVRYDRIEIAGRLRDKLFHGVPFSRNDLIEEARPAFDLLSQNPDQMINSLQQDCELQIARWANDASPARDAARDRLAKE